MMTFTCTSPVPFPCRAGGTILTSYKRCGAIYTQPPVTPTARALRTRGPYAFVGRQTLVNKTDQPIVRYITGELSLAQGLQNRARQIQPVEDKVKAYPAALFI